jgi:hypothetical protein
MHGGSGDAVVSGDLSDTTAVLTISADARRVPADPDCPDQGGRHRRPAGCFPAGASSSNQNDVSLALQGITSQLAAQQAQITELANAVSGLQQGA